jgi:hypothetical protein
VVLTASCLLTALMSFLKAPASEQPFHTIWSCRSFDIFWLCVLLPPLGPRLEGVSPTSGNSGPLTSSHPFTPLTPITSWFPPDAVGLETSAIGPRAK